jgi:hypothetical protein
MTTSENAGDERERPCQALAIFAFSLVHGVSARSRSLQQPRRLIFVLEFQTGDFGEGCAADNAL